MKLLRCWFIVNMKCLYISWAKSSYINILFYNYLKKSLSANRNVYLPNIFFLCSDDLFSMDWMGMTIGQKFLFFIYLLLLSKSPYHFSFPTKEKLIVKSVFCLYTLEMFPSICVSMCHPWAVYSVKMERGFIQE